MSKKFLYLFKEGHDAFGGDQTTMKNILGGKGAGLAEMTHAGIWNGKIEDGQLFHFCNDSSEDLIYSTDNNDFKYILC